MKVIVKNDSYCQPCKELAREIEKDEKLNEYVKKTYEIWDSLTLTKEQENFLEEYDIRHIPALISGKELFVGKVSILNHLKEEMNASAYMAAPSGAGSW